MRTFLIEKAFLMTNNCSNANNQIDIFHLSLSLEFWDFEDGKKQFRVMQLKCEIKFTIEFSQDDNKDKENPLFFRQ